jgi:hypothetical protein
MMAGTWPSPLDAAPDLGRNPHKHVVRVADEQLLRGATRPRALTVIVEHEVDVCPRGVADVRIGGEVIKLPRVATVQTRSTRDRTRSFMLTRVLSESCRQVFMLGSHSVSLGRLCLGVLPWLMRPVGHGRGEGLEVVLEVEA